MDHPRDDAVVPLEPDSLSDFQSLAMCSCDMPALEDMYGRPGDEEITFRVRDLLIETRQILDSQLSLSERDRGLYAGVLVHPAVAALGRAPSRVLVFGGGDGAVVRELLRYDGVENVVVVDRRDPVTAATRENRLAKQLADDALSDQRVTVVNARAQEFVREQADSGPFDLVVFDLLCKPLLSDHEFYRTLGKSLSDDGVLSAQAAFPAGSGPEQASEIVSVFEWLGFPPTVGTFSLESLGGDHEGHVVLASRDKAPAPERLIGDPKGLEEFDDQRLASLFSG